MLVVQLLGNGVIPLGFCVQLIDPVHVFEKSRAGLFQRYDEAVEIHVFAFAEIGADADHVALSGGSVAVGMERALGA
jgi:hypothetical protein